MNKFKETALKFGFMRDVKTLSTPRCKIGGNSKIKAGADEQRRLFKL